MTATPCPHIPVHPLAPVSRCKLCNAVIRQPACTVCKGDQSDHDCEACQRTGRGPWVITWTHPDTP